MRGFGYRVLAVERGIRVPVLVFPGLFGVLLGAAGLAFVHERQRHLGDIYRHRQGSGQAHHHANNETQKGSTALLLQVVVCHEFWLALVDLSEVLSKVTS